VSISTSVRVGEAGPWPKTKALSVSDQKYDTTISSDSFLCISELILPSLGRTGPGTEGIFPQI